ncbi:MAG: ankyrin repeat domain-containing protein, partial [Puniceicoccales bacterium]|nr:ankyrin repeat domain-containing protein [Puniceicoccales bacterium]
MKLTIKKEKYMNQLNVKNIIKCAAISGCLLNSGQLWGALRPIDRKLFDAVRQGLAVQPLIDQGANVNAQDNYHNTPLHLAAEKDNAIIASALIKADANVNAQANFQRTPLHLAGEAGHVNVVQILIEAGADVNALDKNGYTPLHLLLHSREKENYKLITQMLLDQPNIDVNIQDRNGKSLLHFAAQNGYADAVPALINANATIDARDKYGDTPLHLAAEKGHCECVELLLNHDADINARNRKGTTPLFLATLLATLHGKDDAAKMLTRRGA